MWLLGVRGIEAYAKSIVFFFFFFFTFMVSGSGQMLELVVVAAKEIGLW